MIFEELPLPGAFLVRREDRGDERGFFARTFCRKELAAHNLDFEIAQSNISWSGKKGTVRGMHYQRPPHEEIKLVSCMRGSVFDCIIDLRRESASYLRHYAVVLEALGPALYVPRGFAHGFQTLRDDCVVQYLVSADYEPEAEAGVRWNDPKVGIEWPITDGVVISGKDAALPLL